MSHIILTVGYFLHLAGMVLIIWLDRHCRSSPSMIRCHVFLASTVFIIATAHAVIAWESYAVAHI